MLNLKNLRRIIAGPGELKQVLVLRSDLKMGKGKLISQACHASLASYLSVLSYAPGIAEKWIHSGMKKVVLRVSSEKELISLLKQCRDRNIPCELIRDAGRTQIKPGSITALGAGPWEEDSLDKIFGELKLL